VRVKITKKKTAQKNSKLKNTIKIISVEISIKNKSKGNNKF
jgi:hypothetical protein